MEITKFKVITNPAKKKAKEAILKQTSGYVTLYGVAGNKTPHCYIQPMKNRNSGWYYGVDKLTEEQKRTALWFVDPEGEPNELNFAHIKHNTFFNLESDKDRIILEWLLECSKIALSKDDANSDPEATYYVYSALAEKTKTLEKFKLKDEIIIKINSTPTVILAKAMRTIGDNVLNLAPEDVILYAREKIEQGDISLPTSYGNRLLSALEDPQMEVKASVYSWIDKGVIRKDKTSFKFDDFWLGESVESICGFLMQQDMASVLLDIRHRAGEFVTTGESEAITELKKGNKKAI
jgi:hypothetical protein